MQLINVTDDWKEYFDNHGETPNFYAYRANIFISTNNNTDDDVHIEIYDNIENNNIVITIHTNSFSANIMQPEFDEDQRWTEQNFKELTQPIKFDDPEMNVHLNNNGTEDWYEFILDQDDEDKIASIHVREFNIKLIYW